VLLQGDPSIRWQTMRDLLDKPDKTVAREQMRVAKDGWGAQLLALQSADGRWAGGLFTPKWTSTTYTMVLLRGLGLPAGNQQAIRACGVLMDAGFWKDGGMNFWSPRHKSSETCVSSMILAVVCHFRFSDERVDRLAAQVIEHQMPDGGWNCRAMPGYGSATHGSFHTTISAMEALLEYERFRPGQSEPARLAQARGREFLLRHRLFRSHRTGHIVKQEMTRFSYPPWWHYDVLRGLDYFQDACAGFDPRLEDALQLLERRRCPDGCWYLANEHRGGTFFELEHVGEPSRCNTLRKLRVLKWRANLR